jgi:hypothetical protein
VEDGPHRIRAPAPAPSELFTCQMRVDAPLPLPSISRPSFKTQHQLVTLPVEMLEKILGLVRPRKVAESTIPPGKGGVDWWITSLALLPCQPQQLDWWSVMTSLIAP